MIEKILFGFSCDVSLRAEIEKLAASPSAADQAVAVALIASGSWQPTSVEIAVRAMTGDNPTSRAREWAKELKAPELGQIWTERGETYGTLRELLLAVDERQGQSEDEKAREAALRRRLQALSFVIEAQAEGEEIGEGLDETIFLPDPATVAA